MGGLLLAACGGSGSAGARAPLQPLIELAPTGQGAWAANPVLDDLAEVSNNGAGYTGEIDAYELVMPAAGRLQVALHWDHEADFDLFLAADPEGKNRLAAGQEFDFEPEYVGIDVVEGQIVYVLVAGWSGDPGEYTLETILLAPGTPVFGLESMPDPEQPLAPGRPLLFRFNTELDPEQDLDGRIFIGGSGAIAEGSWCIEGRLLWFLPRLPELPGDAGGLRPGSQVTIQVLRSTRGPRAATGEYLADLIGATYTVGPRTDPDPSRPPRVTAVNPPPSLPWDGTSITLVISEPLDPATLFPLLVERTATGDEFPIDFRFDLSQQLTCGGAYEVRLAVSPSTTPDPGTRLRLRLPGSVLGISGEPVASNALTGPEPLSGGLGFIVDFAIP